MTKRSFITLLIIIAVFTFVSCSKDLNNGNVPRQISGRWNIKVDSFSVGFGFANHLQAYNGRDGDYFDFDKDNNLNIKEGSQDITSKYDVISNSTINIPNYGFGGNNDSTFFYIKNLTDHTLTIAAGFYLTPGGIFGRVVYLKR